MKGWIIIIFVLFVVLVVVPVSVVLMILSLIYNHRDRDMRNEAEAHRAILDHCYDHIWNTIKRDAGLTEQHRRSFNNIYPDLIDQNMDNETMIDWLLNCNPDFDPDIYLPLMDSIEDDRTRFVAHQRRMLNLIDEHRHMLSRKLVLRLLKNKSAIRYEAIDTRHDRWGKSL